MQTSAPHTTEENPSSRVVDIPFICPILIHQHPIQYSPISIILYDTCTCRAELRQIEDE
jgi:hypothetical protein